MDTLPRERSARIFGVTPLPGDVASVVRGLFSEVLGADASDEQDFFELGGDSFAGEALLAGVEVEFGVTLPVSILLEAPTPTALARAVMAAREKRMPHGLVPIRSKGKGPPVFCIHGSNGEPMFPRRLAAAIPKRPVYGIRAIGLLKGEVPATDAVEIATNYLAEIKATCPYGPYVIAGHCGPSVIAYEMAQQLVKAGDEVAGLILFDPSANYKSPWLQHSGLWLSWWRARHRGTGRRAVWTARNFPSMNGGERRKMLRRAMQCAEGNYLPAPYPGSTLMICSSARAPVLLDPKRGFPALLGCLETATIDGRHRHVFRGSTKGTSVPAATANAVISFLDRVAPL